MQKRLVVLVLAFWPTISLSEYQVLPSNTPKASDLKTNIIYYQDRTISFTQWTGPEKTLLNLHSAFKEPDIDENTDGVTSSHHEALMVFIAKTSFLVERPAVQLRLDRFLNKTLVQGLDRSVDVQPITRNEVISYKEGGMAFRNPPANEPQWCDDASHSACFKLHFGIPQGLKQILALYFIAHGTKEKSLEAESEIRISEPTQPDSQLIMQLTGVPTQPTGIITESFFWFTHVMQFGKVRAFIQPNPADPQKTVVTGFTVFGIEQKWWNPKNKVGDIMARDVIMGNTFVNHGEGIIQGLPPFTKHLAAAIAEELQH